jgi:hypothetical protein
MGKLVDGFEAGWSGDFAGESDGGGGDKQGCEGVVAKGGNCDATWDGESIHQPGWENGNEPRMARRARIQHVTAILECKPASPLGEGLPFHMALVIRVYP